VLTALAGVVLLQGCSGTQSQPTPPPPPVPDPPKITCPAPISLTSSLGSPISVVYGAATTVGGAPPVTTACVPAIGSIFPVGPSTVTCTATDARQRTDTCTFTVTVTVPPKISATNFVAFGDSMTAGEVVSLGSGGAHVLRVDVEKAYPAALQRILAGNYTTQANSIVVENQGLSLEKAVDGTSRLRGVLSRGSFDAVLLMEGANDLADRDSRMAQQAVAAMRSMVQTAKGRGLKVLLATLPPQNPNGCCPNRGLSWSLVEPYNDGIRGVASAEDIPLVDVYQAFGGNITTLVDVDGLHPTPAGYQRIAEEFFKSIKRAFEQSSSSSSISNPFRLQPMFVPPRRR
jgi:lysophospholipase L1-like esterase